MNSGSVYKECMILGAGGYRSVEDNGFRAKALHAWWNCG